MKKEIQHIRSELALLRAEMQLPAGTTCYLADIHGQGNKFFHIINNKSGALRRKIDQVLPDLTEPETIELLKLCYYPHAYLEKNIPDSSCTELFITSLAKLVSHTGSKLTRADFSQAVAGCIFPEIVSELVSNSNQDKIGSRTGSYKRKLICSLFESGIHTGIILDLTTILRNQLVHCYIINGDIPDRGRDTAQILDFLMDKPEILINWGNHDFLWMGAAAGSRELICDLVRIQLRYGHSALLEQDYGISLKKLHAFALRTYTRKPAAGFYPGSSVRDQVYSKEELAAMQKAIAVILWKLEAVFEPDSSLASVNTGESGKLIYRKGDREYPLIDQHLPTFNPFAPSGLTDSESDILEDLHRQFKSSTRLQRQMRHLAENGSLFRLQDGILSFHATVPVDENGHLKEISILGRKYKGRALFETLNGIYKASFAMADPPDEFLRLFYRGWKGANSWTFGKTVMQTFTRMMIADPKTHREQKSHYYTCLNNPERNVRMVREILDDFTTEGHPVPRKIYNGHIPVKIDSNEEPVRAGGSVICGDGGFSEAYGDIGFVLVATSRGIYLSRLGSGISVEEVLAGGADILPRVIWSEKFPRRLRLKECNSGAALKQKEQELLSKIRENESVR